VISNPASDAQLPAGHTPRVRLGWLASVAVCGVLPIVVLALVFASAIGDDSDAIDFRQYYRAGEAILAGENPYPDEDALLTASGKPYPYPPLPALLSIPLTVVPLDVVEVLVMSLQVILVLAILYVLGVRDWRCYGVALLWPPVISAVQTGNVTLWLALAAAVLWRYRERTVPASAGLGVTLGVKVLLWPLLVWLVATRRWASAVSACAIGALLLLGSWAAIGFDGLRDYPDLLRRLEQTVGDDAYVISNLAEKLGASARVADVLWLAAGIALLAACWFLARHGDERSSFVVAMGAALALSPLVWLHYFALLLVVVCLASTRLAPIWFVPLAMFVATGRQDPTLLQMSVTLAAAAATVGLAVWHTRRTGVQPDPDARALGAATA
jgi:alpha-1,2-mannosyltransferase